MRTHPSSLLKHIAAWLCVWFVIGLCGCQSKEARRQAEWAQQRAQTREKLKAFMPSEVFDRVEAIGGHFIPCNLSQTPQRGDSYVGLEWDNSKATLADVTLLAKVKSLRSLSLRANMTDDAMRIMIPELPELNDISFDGIGSYGTRYLPSLKKLEHLILSGKQVTDASMEDVGKITSLRFLALEDTDVTDRAIAYLADLPKLEELTISAAEEIGDDAMASVARLPNLKRFIVRSDKITDAGMRALSNSSSLVELSLLEAPITGVGLKELAKLSTLRRLIIRCESLTDHDLQSLQGTSLESFRLFDTKVSEEGARNLRKICPELEVRINPRMTL